MLDNRHETFLALCRIRNYTRTAEALHLTQPAVSQHIKYLEALYGGKLFAYSDRKLELTERGRRLQAFAQTVRADRKHLQDLLQGNAFEARQLAFGATLSIGEFVMPPLLARLLAQMPELRARMTVSNTQILLEKLQNGEIEFALVEGYFDASSYGHRRFSQEEFIAVCGPDHPLAGQTVPLEMLLKNRLILRESGSGTREILEHLLYERNLNVQAFESVCEISNMNAIKTLVSRSLGIAFMYRVAAEQELRGGTLREIALQGTRIVHDFSLVYLPNSQHREAYEAWLALFKDFRAEETDYTDARRD